MKAGRGLEERIAVEVMGLPAISWDERAPCPVCGSEMRWCGGRSWCTPCGEWRYGPYLEYSTDIAAAWEVVEKLTEGDKTAFTIRKAGAGTVKATYTPVTAAGTEADLRYGPQPVSSIATTAPLAICLTALKAHGVEEGTFVPEPEPAATGGTE